MSETSRRVAFVTGASRGIGKVTAQTLAARGYSVVLTARTLKAGEQFEYSNVAKLSEVKAMPGSLEATEQAIRTAGGEALSIRMDLLDRDSVYAAVKQAEAAWGPIDLLVNNAIYQGPGTMDTVLDLRVEDLEHLLLGNAVNQLALVQAVLPSMLERGKGCIVNMVSQAAMMDPPRPTGQGGWGYGYAGSKAAFLRLAGVLATEHAGRGVRFVNVEPGLVLTETMEARGMTEQFAKQWGGAPPEVPAAVIAWLADDPEAEAWQGQTVHAQELCKTQGLLEGWPPPRKPS
ncbi:MAG: SDR family oxidoreductase [bacterium]|nr:SDR family oxidoreductase [bacterium]